MAKTFTAQVQDFARLTQRNMRYVAAEAIQDVAEAMQTPQLGVTKGGTYQLGKIPVAESDLINSLSVDGGTPGETSYVVAIAGYQLGDTLKFAYTAQHALAMELGYTTSSGAQVQGRHFVGTAAAQFDKFVAARVAEVNQ